VSFRYFGYIFNSSSLKDEEKIAFQGNQVVIVGRPGIAGLLDLMLDTPAEDAGSEEEEPPELASGSIEPAWGPPPSTGGLSEGAVVESPQPQAQKPVPPVVSGPEPTRHTLETSPQPAADELNIYLGIDTVTGRHVYWNPYTTKPRKLSNPHVLVVGKSGAGKSETTKALVWELSRSGVPSIIFDY
jgi:Mrp family chromosome partitioning ATPase